MCSLVITRLHCGTPPASKYSVETFAVREALAELAGLAPVTQTRLDAGHSRGGDTAGQGSQGRIGQRAGGPV